MTAQLQDLAGNVISADQTLLPFWPGSRAASLASPLKISWLWPLIGQPQQKVCTATLATNDLAADLGPGGRLSALLDAGASHPGAQLTWVIDPALLSDVATMTRRYLVGGQPTCTGAAPQPASTAAASWLAGLRKVTRGPADRAHPVRQRGHDGPGPSGPDPGSRHRVPDRRGGGDQRAARDARA